MRHRIAICVFIANLTTLSTATPALASERDAAGRRERDLVRITRLVRQIVKFLLPVTNGDGLTPPKP
jgi:hypothetical protein